MKQGFTMIELVFVIVIIGILAGIALPRFSVTRTDAEIAKIKSQISAIRTGIQTERGKNILKGTGVSYPEDLGTQEGSCFDKILGAPLKDWTCTSGSGGTATYTKKINNSISVTFEYNKADGNFTCTNGCSHVGE